VQFEYAEVLAPELDAAERVSGEQGVESFTFDDQALDQIFSELAPAPAAAAEQAPPADAFALAGDYLSKGLLDRALGEIRRVAVAGADPVQAALLTAQIFLRQGLDGEALERFDSAIARLEEQPWGEEHSRAWSGRARALLRLGRLPDAREAAEAVREHDPDRVDNLQVLGEALLAGGDAVRAVRVFSRAVELARTDAGLLRNLGRAAQAAGRPGDAERALRLAIKLDPDFVAARLELGRLYLDRGRHGEAAAEARAALEVLPAYADAVELLATALRAAGDRRGAIGALVELLEGDPYHFDALLLLGQVLLDEGRRADARTAFARILRFDAGRADALFHLGVVAAAERRFREAIEHWRRAVDADPDGPYAVPARDNIHTALDIAHVFQTAAAPAAP